MSLFMLITALALQPGAPAPAPPVAVRPGPAPVGSAAAPISEVAEPLALAVAGFDANGDGRTTRGEYDAALARTFAAADRNNDGELGYIEYSGWATIWLGSQSALPGPFAIDADGNDRLSRDEFTAEFGRQFQRLDADTDGAVTHAELLTVRNPRLGPVRERRPSGIAVEPRDNRGPR
jgi:hypothetical protein